MYQTVRGSIKIKSSPAPNNLSENPDGVRDNDGFAECAANKPSLLIIN